MLNDFWLLADPKASRLYCCAPSVPPTSRRPVTTPGHQAGHRPRIAAGGNVLVEVLRDVGLGDGRRDVDDRRRAADGDGLLKAADAELDVDACRARHLHDDPFAPERGEAGELERDRVGAGRQRELVAAGLAGHAGPSAANQALAADRDGDTGEHAALGIAHEAGEGAGLLSGRGRRDEQQAGEHDRRCGNAPLQGPPESVMEKSAIRVRGRTAP